MSTRQSILFRQRAGNRPGFHIYYDLADSPNPEGRNVHMELDGVAIEELFTTPEGVCLTIVLPSELAMALRLKGCEGE